MTTQSDVYTLARIYQETTGSNIRQVNDILHQLGIHNDVPITSFSEPINLSAGALVERWLVGRKTVRTSYAQMMIPGYPESVLSLSLLLDAIINILDDLLDEVLIQEQRATYILELVRILAVYNHLSISDSLRQRIATYFNKCICIVISESIFRDKIREAKNSEKKIDYTIQCYDVKSIDMDIFIELPLIALHGARIRLNEILQLARVHRAIALIKKDFQDIEHDMKNGTETPIFLLSREGSEELKQYMMKLFKHYKRVSLETDIEATEILVGCEQNIRKLINFELADNLR